MIVAPFLCLLLVAVFPLGNEAPLQESKDGGKPVAATRPVVLQIDPLLIAQAADVWGIVAAKENPVWPGWNASDTPLLFYLPGEQDVLINHPKPPAGFVPYRGPVVFPGGQIFVRDGPTLIAWDGQNTSQDIEGIRTLVVADTLSNRKQQLGSLLQDPRPADAKIETLRYSDLATDPYKQLALVVHEAFHVFQERQAPSKSADEMLLLKYPVLSIENNVGFALEAAALASVLRAKSPDELHRAALRWLAVRAERRSKLPPEAIEYEDGTEFSEGLAKYTEYRLYQVLEGRTPGQAMAWAQGFHGYTDLSGQSARLIDQMVTNLRGEVTVNNDPYGTAPLRMRLYYSGMAIGGLLDKLYPQWKQKILERDPTLTRLAEEAIHATPEERASALTEIQHEAGYQELVEKKKRLAEEGRAHIEAMLQEIDKGENTTLLVDYSALRSPDVGMAFTPFGITVVDEDRTFFSQVPITARFSGGDEISQTAPKPLLQDKKLRQIRFQLARQVTRAQFEQAAGLKENPTGTVSNLTLELPGAKLRLVRAEIRWSEGEITVVLLPGDN